MSKPSSTRPPAPGSDPNTDATEPAAHGCTGCEHHAEHEDDDDAPDQDDDADFEPGHAPSVDSPFPFAMARLRARCVLCVSPAPGMPLDFAPETLSILDYYLTLVR